MRGKILGLLLSLSIIVNLVLVALFFLGSSQNAAATGLAAQATATPLPPPRFADRSISVTPIAIANNAPASPSSSPPTTEPTSAPTPTLEPTLAPTLAPTSPPTLAPLTGPEWLQYLNLFRAGANLPPVTENREWSNDGLLHSRYMSLTGRLEHGEDPSEPFYSQHGHDAGQNGNIAATVFTMPPNQWAFNYWMSAVFHALPMIDPELHSVGFGEYRDATAAEPVTATLDIKRGLGDLPSGVNYPVMYPKDGGSTWVLRYSLPEFPFALTSCSGFEQASGPPIMLQIGKGDLTPSVSGTSFKLGDQELPHCEFDETNYLNPDGRFQKGGRSILGQRDAIVLIPRAPLQPDKTYTVRIDANGQSYIWSFNTVKGPPKP